jgi:hypothetical protein
VRKVIVAAAAVAALGVACFPQGLCESPFVDYCGPGDTTCQGHIVGSNQWQSGPIDGAWLPYGPEQTILMHLRDAATGQTLSGTILTVYGAIGAVQTQGVGGPFPGPTAGNIGEFWQGPDSSSVYVRNDTCSSEFVYVVVTLDPATAAIVGPGDAGADATTDATTDAATDASADASTDTGTE